MPQVARHESRRVREGNGRDQQVGAANSLQLLMVPQPVELGSGSGIDGQDGNLTEQLLAADQPGEGPKQLAAIRGLQDEIEASFEYFDSRDGVQSGERVRVEGEHQGSPSSGRPRWR